MATATTDRTDAVKTYIDYLADNSTAVDTEAVTAAQQAYDEAEGVMKLIAHAELQRALDPSIRVQQIEDDFVAHAKAWADEHGVPVESFKIVHNVEARVLRAAGFTVAGRPAGKAKPKKAKAPATRPRVTVETVVDHIPEGEFTYADLAEASGASILTVRKAVAAGVEDGSLVTAGKREHEGRGVAPNLFKKI